MFKYLFSDMLQLSRHALGKHRKLEKGSRDYYWKKMHDPNKFRTKYAKRQGWTYEEGINYSQQFNKWQAYYTLPTQSFPYNIGFDGVRGPIRHRDYRSTYKDLRPSTIFSFCQTK